MTNIELLKVVRDALIAAAKELENYVADCDVNEPDTARQVHDLRELYRRGSLSARSCNCLGRAGFNTLEEVVDKMYDLKGLQKIRNMGPHSVEEVLRVAHELGLKWKWEE